MDEKKAYQSLISEYIKKQIIMLGPQVALSKAMRVSDLRLDPAGQVVAIGADPQKALEDLARQYFELSGQIAKDSLIALLVGYPAIDEKSAAIKKFDVSS